jgi:hypothetical protein
LLSFLFSLKMDKSFEHYCCPWVEIADSDVFTARNGRSSVACEGNIKSKHKGCFGFESVRNYVFNGIGG